MDPETKKQFLLLRNRVYKVYPYARVGAERLKILNQNMAALKTEKEKRKYFKIVEDYMEKEFSPKLKKTFAQTRTNPSEVNRSSNWIYFLRINQRLQKWLESVFLVERNGKSF